MKKYMMIIAGITAALVLSGCGETQPTETTMCGVITEHIETEHILVEETLVEETLVEETSVERSYIDDEYLNEKEYNSRVNTWDNSTTITRWT